MRLFHPVSELLDPKLYSGLIAMNEQKRGERGAHYF
jgi:hypothetical protein